MLQGTDEWKLARVGSVGASDAPKIVRKTKSGYSADRDTLLLSKMLERLTGQPVSIYQTPAMTRGLELEPEARRVYQIVHGHDDVEEVGIVVHPRIKGSHASPDGLVGEHGLVEIKCPGAPAHLDMVEGDRISNDHLVQCMWQMSCTGRKWCDLVSFNPDFPLKLQLYVKRVPRDQSHIAELEREVGKFVDELEAKLDKLKRR
jgi:putative phage-type endonuclease